MDILVRTSQAASIQQLLGKTWEWMEVDDASIPGLVSLAKRGERHSVRRLKRPADYGYISLSREDIYWLMVDTKIQVPHAISLNAGLVESDFHPNFTDLRIRPFLISDKTSNLSAKTPPETLSRQDLPAVVEFIPSGKCQKIVFLVSPFPKAPLQLPPLPQGNIYPNVVPESPPSPASRTSAN